MRLIYFIIFIIILYCNDQKKSLSQLRGPVEEKEGDKMPDWNSWDTNTLPLCKHWRNAHEVPYPYVGANCVEERNPVVVKHEPLEKDALV